MTAVLASASPTFPVLPALIVVPLLGALLVIIVPRRRPELLKLVAVLATMATGALSLWLLFAFDTGVDGFQFASRHVWLGDLGVSWLFGVDGISLFLVVLTGILFPIAILATDPEHDGRAYYAWLLVLEGGVMGVFFDGAGVPHRYLDGTPFDSFVAPGLILGVVVGGTHAVAAGCVFRHRIVRGGARPTARRDTRHPRELIVLSVHPQSVDAQQVHQDRSSIVGAALPWSALQHRVQAPCATGRVFTLVQAHVVVAP